MIPLIDVLGPCGGHLCSRIEVSSHAAVPILCMLPCPYSCLLTDQPYTHAFEGAGVGMMAIAH